MADTLANSFEVLVVDDEPAARELLLEFFQSRGFTVTGAQDGRAAIATLQRSNGSYGLVVTDLSLPGADGFAVLQAARQSNPAAYVVICTGYASLDSAIRAVRVGAYDYLTKPFSLSQLEIILDRIQDRIKLQETNRRLQPGRGVADYPARGGGWEAQVDQRLTAIEQTLARIERALTRAK
ncbi:MAG: response regulator [Acidobacteria bacterium]|nr:response regulator [Acidobacteriota bacterium]